MKSEKTLKAIFEAMHEGLVLQDANGKIVEYNLAAPSILGLSADQLLGKSSMDPDWKSIHEDGSVFSGEDHPAMLALKTEKSVLGIVMGIHQAGGNLRWITINAIPIKNDGKKFVVCTFNDITEKRKLESELFEEKARAIQASKLVSLGEMAAGIAHEINNPLSVIQMRAEQLIEYCTENDVDVKAVLSGSEMIKKTANKISKIVNGLKSFIRDGKDDPNEIVSAQYIVEESISLCHEKIQNANITFDIQVPNIPISLDCKPVQIQQVIVNLLNNAHDAVLNNEEKWIKLSAIDRGDQLEISITDSGKGIPLDIQQKLMQPFFTTKAVGKGTGLGLSISKRIIESHGGKLEIDNQCPNTRFLILLPKAACASEKQAA